jgi:hypothetical protein
MPGEVAKPQQSQSVVHPSKQDSQGLVSYVISEPEKNLLRSAVPQSSMRPVVIILPQVTAEAILGLFDVLVLRPYDFFVFQAG